MNKRCGPGLDGLKTAPPETKELEKAKNQEIAGFVVDRETDEEKAVASEPPR